MFGRGLVVIIATLAGGMNVEVAIHITPLLFFDGLLALLCQSNHFYFI